MEEVKGYCPLQYSQSKEKASEIASEALERIHSESLAPTPENYELWYVYYAELNPEVTRAIDILVANDQEINDERCREIHQRFLSESSENEKVKQAGDKIQETIKTVGGAVSSVKSATSQYNSALEEVAEKLDSKDIDLVDARSALENVVSSTRSMMETNEKLELELTKSTAAMMELQRDLDMVRKEALTDGLTNLANRKAFDAEIVRIMKQAEEQQEAFCLIMMDIDHFKSFNDSYGHQVGDQVLRLVAKTLFDGVKGRDMVARYGGEEFAIILTGADLEASKRVADSLRTAVANKEVINRNSGDKLGRITMSGGIAEYIFGEKLDDLIARADAALYTAKHNGRNQVTVGLAPGQKKAV